MLLLFAFGFLLFAFDWSGTAGAFIRALGEYCKVMVLVLVCLLVWFDIAVVFAWVVWFALVVPVSRWFAWIVPVRDRTYFSLLAQRKVGKRKRVYTDAS
ncbi:hypothetical protein [Paraburkholderia sp.]|uniref:hypothetical protein n=1 Tax=Paraburkholderia sp. TaxID=1926495 RepID=UPI00238C8E30|nr:hypothetical protein [Paraburkholderia sp.]MDE1180192.1 hypothetical protein [Paraburkholderia sp.]